MFIIIKKLKKVYKLPKISSFFHFRLYANGIVNTQLLYM